MTNKIKKDIFPTNASEEDYNRWLALQKDDEPVNGGVFDDLLLLAPTVWFLVLFMLMKLMGMY